MNLIALSDLLNCTSNTEDSSVVLADTRYISVVKELNI